MCASAESSRIRSMPLFARPRFAFIIGWASFCKYGCEPPGLWIRGSLQSCWRTFTEEGYGIMPARGRWDTVAVDGFRRAVRANAALAATHSGSVSCGGTWGEDHGARQCNSRFGFAGDRKYACGEAAESHIAVDGGRARQAGVLQSHRLLQGPHGAGDD